MPKIQPISYKELEKFVKYVGCTYVRQTGSHRVYWRSDLIRPIIIPVHSKDIPIFIKNGQKTPSFQLGDEWPPWSDAHFCCIAEGNIS